MPLLSKALLPFLSLTLALFLTLEARAMPISYAQQSRSQSQVSPSPAFSPDPFGAQLLTLLDDASDIASEKVWQEIPKLIARQWSSFTQYQSPFSTMGMISRAAETVLKIRLASRRGGGEEESRRLEEFQALMADIWGSGTDEPDAMRVVDEGGGPA